MFVKAKLFHKAGEGRGGGDSHDLGYYATLSALQTAHPTANNGDFAIVGSTDTVWVWDGDTSAWVDTAVQGQVISVNNKTGAVTLTASDVGAQPTLVNQTNIKSVDGNSLLGSGNLELSTYLTYPAGWTTNSTTKAFCDGIAADTTAVKGKAYLGEVTCSDLPASISNAEVVVEIMDGTTSANKVIVLSLKSGNVAPYAWQYVYWDNGTNVSGWKTWQETLVSGTNIKTINNTSILGSGNITVDSLPAQSGQSGKFLTTDGTNASWGSVSFPVSSVNNQTGAVTLTASDVGALPDNTHIPADPVQADWNEADSGALDYIKNKPTIPAAQVNSDWNAVSGVAQILNKPSLATVATSGSYTDLTNTPSIPSAQVNSDWNSTSGVSEILNKPSLAAVATSGSYSDLTNTPSIPAAQVNSDWNAVSGVSEILNKPTLSAVATSGAYSDLSGTPSIPTKASDVNAVPQLSTLPTASVDYLGQVVQFVGTTGTYTNGYFYECVSDGQPTPTYSWTQKAVQPSSGGLPSQSGQSGKFLTTDGTDASWATISALQNTASGSNSLTIAGTAATNSKATNVGVSSAVSSSNGTAIGYNARAAGGVAIGCDSTGGTAAISIGRNASTAQSGVAVGAGATTTGTYSTAIGSGAKANANHCLSLGSGAETTADCAIQLGKGTNATSYTLGVGFYDSGTSTQYEYELLSPGGTIPTDRFTTTPSADGTYVPTLTISSGVATRSWAAPGGGGSVPTLTWYTVSSAGNTLTIADTSSAQLVKIYKNGLLLQPTDDYTISGTTLTTVAALVVGDKITTEVF